MELRRRALAAVRLRPLRGHRLAGHGRVRRAAARRRGQHRRLRARRRRGGGAGDGRGGRHGCCPACSATPTRPSTTRSRPGAMENLLEGPVYTKPPDLAGARGPGDPAVRAPRQDRPVAAGRGAAPYRREPARAGWRQLDPETPGQARPPVGSAASRGSRFRRSPPRKIWQTEALLPDCHAGRSPVARRADDSASGDSSSSARVSITMPPHRGRVDLRVLA